jgi:uncharacterized 2Fe-2S/4Fe-4S cluster protein (DUF4445 family)
MMNHRNIFAAISRGNGSATEQVELAAGNSLLEDIRNSIPGVIDAPCGGRGTCGKCKLIITSGDAGPVSTEEKRLLTHEELQGGMRLACKCYPLSDITADIAAGGAHAVLDAIGAFDEDPDPLYLDGESCGVAVDIGTTTVVAYLVDFSKPARVTGVRSALNAQRPWGADVISRISFAGEAEGHLEKLSQAVRNQVDQLIRLLLKSEHKAAGSIREIAIAGNTTMLHLFAGVDPSSIAVAPFTPVFVDEVLKPASEFHFDYPEALIRLIPSIAGYVGADISAGIAAVGMDRSEGLALLLDLGTNGEMALGNRDRILTCATAAGPAFEGAGISCGTGGVPGAIDTVVVLDGKLNWTTIGGEKPVGICGSGILDTVAALLSLGVIDDSGAMAEEYAESGFCLSPRAGDSGGVCFTQRDVRQLQLAKGAVAAGVRVLLEEWGAEPEDITAVYLAGGFGNYLRPSSALEVGLLPSETGDNIVAAKNSAGLGAVRVLLFRDEAERIRTIARKAEYIELSTDSRFQDHFMDQMFFPEPVGMSE